MHGQQNILKNGNLILTPLLYDPLYIYIYTPSILLKNQLVFVLRYSQFILKNLLHIWTRVVSAPLNYMKQRWKYVCIKRNDGYYHHY